MMPALESAQRRAEFELPQQIHLPGKIPIDAGNGPRLLRIPKDMLRFVDRLMIVIGHYRDAGLVEQPADGLQIRAAWAGQAQERERRDEQRKRKTIPDFILQMHGPTLSACRFLVARSAISYKRSG